MSLIRDEDCCCHITRILHNTFSLSLLPSLGFGAMHLKTFRCFALTASWSLDPWAVPITVCTVHCTSYFPSCIGFWSEPRTISFLPGGNIKQQANDGADTMTSTDKVRRLQQFVYRLLSWRVFKLCIVPNDAGLDVGSWAALNTTYRVVSTIHGASEQNFTINYFTIAPLHERRFVVHYKLWLPDERLSGYNSSNVSRAYHSH